MKRSYSQSYTQSHKQTNTQTHTHTNKQKHKHTNTHKHKDTYKQLQKCIYINTVTYALTHTQTYIVSQALVCIFTCQPKLCYYTTMQSKFLLNVQCWGYTLHSLQFKAISRNFKSAEVARGQISYMDIYQDHLKQKQVTALFSILDQL